MMRVPRAEIVLPLVIVLGAVILVASEFMVTFELTAGGEPQSEQFASDRHSYALLILAVFSVAGMLVAIATGLRAAAFATAAFGVAALLLFLLLDLPDAGNTGTVKGDEFGPLSFATLKAEPQIGFWLEAIGSLALGLAAGAFATLRSEQLRAPAGVIARRREERSAKHATPESASSTERAAPTQSAAKPAAVKAEPTAAKPASRRRPRKGDDAIVPFDLESGDETKAEPSSNGRRGLLARLKSSNR